VAEMCGRLCTECEKNKKMNTDPPSRIVLVSLQVFKTLFEVGAWRAACANASTNVKSLVKTFKVGGGDRGGSAAIVVWLLWPACV
jgi:hypothetical protein